MNDSLTWAGNRPHTLRIMRFIITPLLALVLCACFLSTPWSSEAPIPGVLAGPQHQDQPMLTRVLSLLGLAVAAPDPAALATEALDPEAKAKALDLEQRLPPTATESEEAYAKALAKLYREPTLARYVAALEKALEQADLQSALHGAQALKDQDASSAEILRLQGVIEQTKKTQVAESARAGAAEGELAEARRRIQDLERRLIHG